MIGFGHLIMDVNVTFGAAYIGLSASIFAFGILSAQVYTYYHRYPLDRPAYKFLVAFLWVLEALHTALTSHFFYIYAISNWGNVLVLLKKPIWSLVLQVGLGAFVGTIVKGCFAMRVWRFSKHNIWITSFIIISTLIQLGFSLWFTIRGFRLTTLTDIYSIFGVATVALSLGPFTDILTAFTLCYYLRQLKSTYSRSNSLVNHLMLYAINTGIITSTFSVACLICYNLMPKNFVFIGLFFVISKLYANSFLATLNTRQISQGRGTDNEQETVPTFVMALPRLPHTQDQYSQYNQGPKSDHYSDDFHVSIYREISIKSDPTAPVSPGQGSNPLSYGFAKAT